MANTVVMYRGDNRTISLTVKKTDGTVYSLTGCTVNMYIKEEMDDLNVEAIISKSGTLTDAVNGVVEFYLIPSDTNDAITLKDNVPYPCDFEVTTGAGKIYTVLRTSFVILKK